jgi:ribosomal protein S18 acetylase RimI-like enzyme
MFEIRELTNDDLVISQVEIKAFVYAAIVSSFDNISDIDVIVNNTYDNIVSYKKDGSAILYGAFDSKLLVGFTWGYERTVMNEPRIHINMTAVSEDYRHQGLGINLISKLETETKNRGINCIEFIASCVNEGIIAMHKSMGYAIERVVMKKIL